MFNIYVWIYSFVALIARTKNDVLAYTSTIFWCVKLTLHPSTVTFWKVEGSKIKGNMNMTPGVGDKMNNLYSQ